jgi:hypothetical protein
MKVSARQPFASAHEARVGVGPNPSIERTSSGKAPWPRGAQVHVAPRGQGASPTAAAHVKR